MGPLLGLLLQGLVWLGLIGLGAFLIKFLVVPALILVGLIGGGLAFFYLVAKGLVPRKYRFPSMVAGIVVLVSTAVLYNFIHYNPFSIAVPLSTGTTTSVTKLEVGPSTPLFDLSSSEPLRDVTLQDMLIFGLAGAGLVAYISKAGRRRR